MKNKKLQQTYKHGATGGGCGASAPHFLPISDAERTNALKVTIVLYSQPPNTLYMVAPCL